MDIRLDAEKDLRTLTTRLLLRSDYNQATVKHTTAALADDEFHNNPAALIVLIDKMLKEHFNGFDPSGYKEVVVKEVQKECNCMCHKLKDIK